MAGKRLISGCLDGSGPVTKNPSNFFKNSNLKPYDKSICRPLQGRGTGSIPDLHPGRFRAAAGSTRAARGIPWSDRIVD